MPHLTVTPRMSLKLSARIMVVNRISGVATWCPYVNSVHFSLSIMGSTYYYLNSAARMVTFLK